MNVVNRKISEIKPYEKNAKIHDEKQIANVAESIKQFGFVQPVVDLFAGSGTTVIAAEQNNRQTYLMEYDPKYCDVIIDRWQQLTGEKAVKL